MDRARNLSRREFPVVVSSFRPQGREGDSGMSKMTGVSLWIVVWALTIPLWAQDCTIREIGTDESQTALFAAGDCRLRDVISGSRSDSYVHRYRVTLAGDGVLTVDLKSTTLDSQLYVYSLSNVRLAANDNISAASQNSRVVISLQQGAYVLIATTRTAAAGSYTIQTALGPRSACEERELSLEASLDGELAVGGCRVMDVTAPSTDSSLTVPYRLAVASSGVLAVKMASSAFSPYFEILDAGRQRMFYFDAEGESETEATVSLDPGNYLLLASSSLAGDTGKYTLTARIEPPHACETREIKLDDTATGELSYERDCRYLDLESPSYDTTPVHLYKVSASQAGVLSLKLSSAVFTPFVAIFDEKGQRLNSTADDPEPGPTAQIDTSLPLGTFLILVNTWDLDGAYTLRSTFGELRACGIHDAQPGGSLEGTLATGGCRLLDLLVPNDSSTYAAGYRLSVPERKILTAELSSAQIDPALRLYSPDRLLLAADDNGGGGTNSRLTTLLSPGNYMLAAIAADGATGTFTLRTQFADPPACPIASMELAGTISGELTSADCRVRETVIGSTGGSYVKRYRVTVAERGRLRLTVSSRTMATALVLTDADGKVLRLATTEVDGAARTGEVIEAGTYIVHVLTMQASQTGSFTLQCGFEPGG